MRIKKHLYLVSLFSLSLLFAGCSSEAEIRATTGVAGIGPGGSGDFGTDLPGGDTGDGSVNNGAACTDLLCLQVTLFFRDTGIATPLTNCRSSGFDTLCSVSVPERDLFLNDLQFVSQTGDSQTCEYLQFEYYRYRRSDSAVYTPPGSQVEVDCSIGDAAQESKSCWGGAWTESEIFPNFTRRFINTAVNNLLTIDVLSSLSFSPGNPIGNRFAANDLSSRSVSAANYHGGSMVDYEVSCLDEFNETVSNIILEIVEDDGPIDQINGWD